MYHFLVQTLLGSRWTQRSRVRVLALARNFFEHLRKRTRLKDSFFQFFSALCDFRIFLHSKGPTFKFFWYFAANKVSNSPKGLPFYVFRHYETIRNSHFSFFSKVKKIRKFLSQRVRPPFNLFDILQQTGFSKSSKGPPFTGLKTLRFLSLRYSADFRRSHLVLQAFRSMFPLFPVLWDFPLFGFVRLSKIF